MEDLELIKKALDVCKEITNNHYHLCEYEMSDLIGIYSFFTLKHKKNLIRFIIWQIADNSAKSLRIVNNTNYTDNISVEFNLKGIKTF